VKGPSCSNGLTATGRVFALLSQRTDGHVTNRVTDYVSAMGPQWWRACAWPRALWVQREEPTSLGMWKRGGLDRSVYTRTICFSSIVALPSRSSMQVTHCPSNNLIIWALYIILSIYFFLRDAIAAIRKFQNYTDLSLCNSPHSSPRYLYEQSRKLWRPRLHSRARPHPNMEEEETLAARTCNRRDRASL